ncbi:MAG: DUF1801 domain-containing protein [Verrucomicrobiota bacterium]
MNRKPTSVDEYLDALDAVRRSTLLTLREHIRRSAPGAEECLSYSLPAFRLNGRALVAYGAARNHCALYPMSSSVLAAFRDRLGAYDTSKGTLRFPIDRPIPASLLRQIVRARIAENAAAAERAGKPRAKKAQVRRTGTTRGRVQPAGKRTPPSTPRKQAHRPVPPKQGD